MAFKTANDDIDLSPFRPPLGEMTLGMNEGRPWVYILKFFSVYRCPIFDDRKLFAMPRHDMRGFDSGV